MATDIFFFTDPSKLEPQTALEAFGDNLPAAAGVTVNRSYNFASVHKAKPNQYPPAYAVTSGQLRVLEEFDPFNGNAPLPTVTLILKPNVFEAKFTLPKVKYFIYRGVLKSSLYDINQLNRIIRHEGSGFPLSKAGAPLDGLPGIPAEPIGYQNDLTKAIVSKWMLDNVNAKNPIAPSNKNLGTNKKQQLVLGTPEDPDEIPIDYLFQNDFGYPGVNTNPAVEKNYEAYPVEAGWEIGRYQNDNKGFSFEIVLDSTTYSPKVKDYNKITDGSDGSYYRHLFTESNATTFQTLSNKQVILNYMDPCAFFGTIGSEVELPSSNFKFHLLLNPTGTDKNDSVIELKEDFYKKILSGEDFGFLDNDGQSIFYNRNKVYVDIRDQFGNSYNYFKTLYNNPDQNDIQLSFQDSDSAAYSDVKYYPNIDLRGWPLLKVDNNPTGYIRIAFPATKTNPIQNPINSGAKEHFFVNILNRNSVKDVDYSAGEPYTFIETKGLRTIAPGVNFHEGITLIHQVRNSGGSNKAISSYIRMTFIKESSFVVDQDVSSVATNPISPSASGFPTHPSYEVEKDYMSFVFPVNFNLGFRKKSTNSGTVLASHTTSYACFVENHARTGKCFMADLGIALDRTGEIDYINLYAYPSGDTKNKAVSVPTGPLTGDNLFAQKIQTSDLKFINDSFSSFEALSLESRDNDFIMFRFQKQILNSALNIYNQKFLAFKDTPNTVNEIYIENSPVYLRFEPQSSSFDNNPTHRFHNVSFKVFVEGYVFNQSSGTDTYYKVKYEIPTPHNSFSWPIAEFDSKKLPVNTSAGSKGIYKDDVVSRGVKMTTEMPDIVKLKSRIYLLKTPNTSYNTFKNQYNYLQKNIQHIWSTQSNKGLARAKRSDSNSIIAGQQYDNVTTTLSMFWLTESQLRFLDDGELIVVIEENNSTPRFFVLDNGFNKRVMHAFASKKGLSPAHEFGHLLGLDDRYTYVAMTNIDNKLIKSSGKNINCYLDEDVDPDYCEDGIWRANLMAVANIVPYVVRTDQPDPIPDTFQSPGINSTEQDFMRAMYAVSSLTPLYTNTTTEDDNIAPIFITPTQWNIVKRYLGANFYLKDPLDPASITSTIEELKQEDFVFFIKGAATNSSFNGTFIGISSLPDNLNGAIMSDHNATPDKKLKIIQDERNMLAPAGNQTDTRGYFSLKIDPSGRLNGFSAKNQKQQMLLIIGSDLENDIGSAISTFVANKAISDNPDKASIIELSESQIKNATYFNIAGTSDAFGRVVWNLLHPYGDTDSAKMSLNFGVGTRYATLKVMTNAKHYVNREWILELIEYGNIPNP